MLVIKTLHRNQVIFIQFIFHSFSNYDYNKFFKKIVDKKDDKAVFKTVPKTKEEYISVTHGCLRFNNSYRFLSGSLDSLVETLADNSHKILIDLGEEIVDIDGILKFADEIKISMKKNMYKNDSIEDLKKIIQIKFENLNKLYLCRCTSENDFKILKIEFPDKWKYSTKKSAYPHECFNSFEDYQKRVDKLKKEDFFSKLKNDYPSDKEIERTKENIKLFDIKNGEKLAQLYVKSDNLLLACVSK